MELTPKLDPSSKEAIYMQLYRSIRDDILLGRIQAGARLPSIRRLCSRLGLSRTPVALAYEQLQAEGYVISKPRSGLFAAELPPALSPHPGAAAEARSMEVQDEEPLPPVIDFGYGAVDLSAFPAERWRRLMNRCLLSKASPALQYGDIQGEPQLRRQIAAYLHQMRGVRCDPEQIVIGAGTYHSLDLLLQLLEGDVRILASEESINTGVMALFRRFGYSGSTLLPLPLEADGASLSPLRSASPDAIYLTPSHQFPYGMILSAAKRLQLLQWASASNGYLIENDYDGEFRYGGAPIPSLQGMDTAGRVIYLGTFSRALTPSFRLSYLVLPQALLRRFRAGSHSYDQLASPLFQETLRHFMESGDLERHMRRMRLLYENKHAVLLEALHESFGDGIRIIGAGSGLHVLAETSLGLNEAQLIRQAALHGVRVYPVSVYRLSPENIPQATVMLGFGGLSPEEIRTGIGLLAQAWLPKPLPLPSSSAIS